MNEKLSIKITIISFLLLLGVVLAHSTNADYNQENTDLSWYLQQLYLDKLSNIIVPTFFFISGFLFFLSFRNKEIVNFGDFKDKIKKRIRTLLIPYLFWCALWFFFIYIIQFVPFLAKNSELPLHKMTIIEQVYNLYLEPINYPFWFIRELILYIIISPILYAIIKYGKWVSLIFLFVMALFSSSVFSILNISLLKYLMLFFFLAGAYAAINSVELKLKVKPKFVYIMLFSWVLLEFILLYFEVKYVEKSWVTKLLTNLLIILGSISCWSLYDVLDDRYDFKYKKIYTYGFFIYASHGIPIIFFKKFIISKMNFVGIEFFLFYIFTFFFISILCLTGAVLSKKFMPKIYNFSTGNR